MSNHRLGVYSLLAIPQPGDTSSGLDQLIDSVNTDPGLAGANRAEDILAGAAAANALNHLILEAAAATGAAADGYFSSAEVVAMNAWIRANRLTEWTYLHGDDENNAETGYHRVQNDGANIEYRGDNLINTVADGIYHLGFAIENGHFLNEDGDPNAAVSQVAEWLTQFFTDHSSTNTGLDRLTNLIMADRGLDHSIGDDEIADGADAADDLNHLILDGLAATGGFADDWISSDDVIALNAWIRADAARLAQFTALHGDDECGEETGYHLVQNDGADTYYFGRNLVNTVADGIYHIGFEIRGDRLLNEDGNKNARVDHVADWLNYFLADQSTTGTGLDRITDHIKLDTGLAQCTSAADINAGAGFADSLNHLVLDAASAVNALADGWFTQEDLVAMNAWVRADAARLAQFVALHGDDENGEETGYHLVQNDGANTDYFGDNLINTVADGIFHFGFEIHDGRFFNEDGDPNAYLGDVAGWLNYFVNDVSLVLGDGNNGQLTGTDGRDHVIGAWNGETIQTGAGTDLIYGGYGDDTIRGGAGADQIFGDQGDDFLDGGNDGDTYYVSGNQAGGWSSFNGYDTYADSGTSGTDKITVQGSDVDIGIRQFSAASGIEIIDASAATGTVRLIGEWTDDTLDFRATRLIGNNFIILGEGGDDTLYGSNVADTMHGGYGNDTLHGGAGVDKLYGEQGDDYLDGGNGSDTYFVTGTQAGGWSKFNGFDTYADSGTTGTDKIVVQGGDVDIGLRQFSAANGIEVIDASAATGTVRLIGEWTDDTLDFRITRLIGSNIVILGEGGDDTLYGSSVADILHGGYGNDSLQGGAGADQFYGDQGDDYLDGGNGSDTYFVTGTQAGGWSSFNGFDTYADSGTTGTDKIVAQGGDVDIGLRQFSVANGIETIDASAATGTLSLIGEWTDDTLDFRTTRLIGSNIVILGEGGDDTLYGSSVADILHGGYGNDSLHGGAGADQLYGDQGDDYLDGGNGSDTYFVTGTQAGGWSSFNGFDTYADSGTTGTDKIVAQGGDVDIGLRQFSVANGIETIDASAATGTVSLIGEWTDDTLDFRTTCLIGSNIVILGEGGDDMLYGSSVADILHGGYGNDSLQGGAGADQLYGDQGDDYLDGGNGSDTYFVTGTQACGWSKFNGFDTYADSGTTGTDKIVAQGGDVDIGLKQFSAANGIEIIDASAATGTVRLFGEWSNESLDFRATQLVGSNLLVDGAGGNDVIVGSLGADTLLGGSGNDVLVGGGGIDMLEGGSGTDMLLGAGTLVGGAGRDRFLLAEDDGSSISIRGGKATGSDGEADVLTLLGSLGNLRFQASVVDFDKGKDRLDLSQLLDGEDQQLNLDDLLIQSLGGNTLIGFQEGVHTQAGGEVDVNITLLGVQSVAASDFYFASPSLPAELMSLEIPLDYV